MVDNNSKLKEWIFDNAWAVLTYIVSLIVACSFLWSKVDVNAAELDETRVNLDMHVTRIDNEINQQEDVDSEILQEVREINAKLDLILDGKIKLD